MSVSARAQAILDRINGLKAAADAHHADEANHDAITAAAATADDDGAIEDALATLEEALGLPPADREDLPEHVDDVSETTQDPAQ